MRGNSRKSWCNQHNEPRWGVAENKVEMLTKKPDSSKIIWNDKTLIWTEQ